MAEQRFERDPMTDRRTFLKRAALAINGLIALVLAIPAVRYLLDPLRRDRAATGFIRLLPLSALSPGRPLRVTVVAERVDAYTRHPPGPIGNVFLIREPDVNGRHQVRCLQVICPHLGCAVDYQSDRGAFSCPCHASEFDLSGQRRFGPSPRDLDTLECRVTEADPSGQHWVEASYAEFKTGIAEKQPRI
jgi:menaquinol-cytochrome c reductase iron-sulfur subunit